MAFNYDSNKLTSNGGASKWTAAVHVFATFFDYSKWASYELAILNETFRVNSKLAYTLITL